MPDRFGVTGFGGTGFGGTGFGGTGFGGTGFGGTGFGGTGFGGTGTGGTGLSGSVYMLDAETCGAVLHRSQSGLLAHLVTIRVTEVCISSVSLSELLFAAQMSRSLERDLLAIELFLKHVSVVAYSNEAAREYGAIRERLFWREEMIGMHELLVAAHAKALGATLVTKRLREFGRVPGLMVENWSG